MTQSELKITELMFDALNLEYNKIDIQQHNTYAFILSKESFENLQSQQINFNLALNNVLNFSEFENLLEITFKNTNEQTIIQRSEKQIDFLFSFLKDQKYYRCEFNYKQIEGILLKADREQIIQSLKDFVVQQLFNINLKDDDFTQLNFRESQDIVKEKEIISYNTQNRQENINLQEIIYNQNTNYDHMSNKNLCDKNNQIQFEKQQTKNQNDKQKVTNQEKDILKQQEVYQQNKGDSIADNSINITQQNNNLEQQNDLIQNSKTKQIQQLIEEYDFKEYLIKEQQPIFDQKNVNKIGLREWSEAKFQIANKNQIFNEQFKTNQSQILEVLKNKNYYLCKCILSDQKQNIFIGYQSISDQVQIDFIFLVIQNYTQKDIKDYLQVKYFNEEVNQFIFKQNQLILILKKDIFIYYHNQFDKLKFMINWSKEDFKKSNLQAFNDLFCKICKNNNENKMHCKYCEILFLFQENQDQILNKMEEKQYHLQEYLNKGGCGIIFKGYKFSLLEYQEVAFKIQFEEGIEDEIKIMKLFEHNQNVIQFKDYIKINDKIHVLVLEKCKYSLAQELLNFKKDKIFPKQKLLKMMRQLIHGLVLFRIYNILHLDIKPANILVTSSDNYVFTDFGISSLKIKNQQAEVKGYTNDYAPPEQLKQENQNEVDFKTDIYSLGKTYEKILEDYKNISGDQDTFDLFNSIIKEHMTQKEQHKRKECIYLLQQILKNCLQNDGFEIFINSFNFIKLNEYDQNKDIIQFQEIKIQYYFCYLALFKLFEESHKNDFILQQVHSYFLDKISDCYTNIGDYYKALEYQLESLKMRKQIFQKNHPIIASSLERVGKCFRDVGDIQKSLKYSLKSLKIRKQIFKEIHPDIASSFNSVGNCYGRLGDKQKALEYSLESLKMFQQIFKEIHPEIASSLDNVGNCYRYLGDNQKSFEYQLKSFKMKKQIYKENHPSIAFSLNNFGLCYQNLGSNQKALKYQLKSLKVFQQIFKEIHPNIAKSLNNVGSCYIHLGDNQKALEYLLESLKMTKQIFKENHPDIPSSLLNIGSCYELLGESQKAMLYYLESLKIFQQIFKEYHPHIAISLSNISYLYLNIGDNQMALEYAFQTLQVRKLLSEENDLQVAKCLQIIADCYKNLGDNQKFQEYELKVKQIQKQIFAKNYLENLSTLDKSYLDTCDNRLLNLANNQKTSKNQKISLVKLIQIFKENNPYISESLKTSQSFKQNIGKNKNYLLNQLKSLQMKRQFFKENHQEIEICLNNISSCYLNIGDNKMAKEYQLESDIIFLQYSKENHLGISSILNNIDS